MQLEPILRQIIDDIAFNSSSKEITKAAEIMSRRYRRLDEEGGKYHILSPKEAKAYVITRFPATYMAISRTLETLALADQEFSPTNILDIGAGPATATLAALRNWTGVKEVTLIEPNQHLRTQGEELLSKMHPDIKAAWHGLRAQDTEAIHSNKYDLVIAGYVLNEILEEAGPKVMLQVVQKMWEITGHSLVFVEPGTPFGQDVILRIREFLLDQGGNIVAPCPHNYECPIKAQWLSEDKWCHFSVRVERTKAHRHAKQASLGFEDERFSYIIFNKKSVHRPEYRVLGRPRGKKVVRVEVCTEDGEFESKEIAKSSPYYKEFKKASWGKGLTLKKKLTPTSDPT